jgi:hypothetical protein
MNRFSNFGSQLSINEFSNAMRECECDCDPAPAIVVEKATRARPARKAAKQNAHHDARQVEGLVGQVLNQSKGFV